MRLAPTDPTNPTTESDCGIEDLPEPENLGMMALHKSRTRISPKGVRWLGVQLLDSFRVTREFSHRESEHESRPPSAISTKTGEIPVDSAAMLETGTVPTQRQQQYPGRYTPENLNRSYDGLAETIEMVRCQALFLLKADEAVVLIARGEEFEQVLHKAQPYTGEIDPVPVPQANVSLIHAAHQETAGPKLPA